MRRREADDFEVVVRRPPAAEPSRRVLPVLALASVVALLCAATLYFSFASRSNHDAAVKWRAHAQQSDKLVTARTHQLNVRSAALNRTAAQLTRSESDVKTLETRQRKLADEKAQVEDQRGAMVIQTSQLSTLADEQSTCSSGLTALLREVAAGDYAAVDADAPAVDQACRQAQADFAAFQNGG